MIFILFSFFSAIISHFVSADLFTSTAFRFRLMRNNMWENKFGCVGEDSIHCGNCPSPTSANISNISLYHLWGLQRVVIVCNFVVVTMQVCKSSFSDHHSYNKQ